MTRITVIRADITAQAVDAVVNAANERLSHGGGVAAAISRAGGPAIQAESDAWVAAHGLLSPGIAAITSGGALPARWVVHVAGPIHGEGHDDPGLLTIAVRTALDAAVSVGARSVGLPAISAGIYGYPMTEATAVITQAVLDWCTEHPEALDEVRLVGWSDDAVSGFELGLRNG
ncbi:MAG: macro domain-containing protein [Acidimicrobiia bacterium]|nr:macro domain-containing protein [Acidimicrobiia bacterium]